MLALCRLHQTSNLPWTRHPAALRRPQRAMEIGGDRWRSVWCPGETTWGQCEQSKSSGGIFENWATSPLPRESHVDCGSNMDHMCFTIDFVRLFGFLVALASTRFVYRHAATEMCSASGVWCCFVQFMAVHAGELRQRMFGAEGAKLWH